MVLKKACNIDFNLIVFDITDDLMSGHRYQDKEERKFP